MLRIIVDKVTTPPPHALGRREIEALALASVQRRLGEYTAGAAELAAEVAAGSLDPFAAASRLLDQS